MHNFLLFKTFFFSKSANNLLMFTRLNFFFWHYGLSVRLYAIFMSYSVIYGGYTVHTSHA